MSEVIGFACLATALAFFWAAWFDYSWRMVAASIVLIIVGGLCLASPSHAQGAPPCTVRVVLDLTTYDGPKHYDDLCLSLPATYGDGLLMIEAVGIGDKLFHGDFEP